MIAFAVRNSSVLKRSIKLVILRHWNEAEERTKERERSEGWSEADERSAEVKR